MPQIHHNHLGYHTKRPKLAVLRAPSGLEVKFELLCQGDIVYQGKAEVAGAVTGWRDWHFYRLDFSDYQQPGPISIQVHCQTSSGQSFKITSNSFQIQPHLLFQKTFSDVLNYFKSQRSSGQFDTRDRALPFFSDTRSPVDLHGGWFDASGDTSKYLSHLAYTNFLSPQQTPMLVWNLARLDHHLEKTNSDLGIENLRQRLRDEAFHGGDFLVRMQDPDGYFYMTIFDGWSKQLEQREVCAYSGARGDKSKNWQAAWRQGGGIAIAALARLARFERGGEYNPKTYLATAEKGYAHLQEHNLKYLDDGKENIIDDYCALLAAVELFRTTGRESYLANARARADKLTQRLSSDQSFSHWWRADDKQRPYFHAAEAGLPVISLLEYCQVEPDANQRARIKACIQKSLEFELDVTNTTNNPFGYARQYVQDLDGNKRDSFFMPQNNDSGYWWQGENARLASLAAAARMALPIIENLELKSQLETYAQDQLNWILGLNPFDLCMLHGHGRNNPGYIDAFPNAAGGICNGITSGYENENDIDFAPENAGKEANTAWRWGEQWLVHGAWYILAIGLGYNE